mmetsp:Transcript_107994/g.214536  ORF Transcript_107994/g.214536 Transcript_107994/m.214536 type:complete len:331 (+) Transcript_107994:515-1507(+)
MPPGSIDHKCSGASIAPTTHGVKGQKGSLWLHVCGLQILFFGHKADDISKLARPIQSVSKQVSPWASSIVPEITNLLTPHRTCALLSYCPCQRPWDFANLLNVVVLLFECWYCTSHQLRTSLGAESSGLLNCCRHAGQRVLCIFRAHLTKEFLGVKLQEVVESVKGRRPPFIPTEKLACLDYVFRLEDVIALSLFALTGGRLAELLWCVKLRFPLLTHHYFWYLCCAYFRTSFGHSLRRLGGLLLLFQLVIGLVFLLLHCGMTRQLVQKLSKRFVERFLVCEKGCRPVMVKKLVARLHKMPILKGAGFIQTDLVEIFVVIKLFDELGKLF